MLTNKSEGSLSLDEKEKRKYLFLRQVETLDSFHFDLDVLSTMQMFSIPANIHLFYQASCMPVLLPNSSKVCDTRRNLRSPHQKSRVISRERSTKTALFHILFVQVRLFFLVQKVDP